MDICDICAQPLEGKGQTVENDRIWFAAAALGVSDKPMGEFTKALGMPYEHMPIVWLKRQDNPNKPWNLCPECALRIERLAYSAESAIKEKQRKKAWQFWK